MANNNFMKTTLSLTSPICMDINDSVVRPFDSFNKKNAPFVGDQLSPFYVSRETAKEGEVTPVYDEAGNRWSLINNQLCKNGKVVNGSPTFENSYSKTKTDKIYIYQSHFFQYDEIEIYIKDGFYYLHAISHEGFEVDKKITEAYENDIYGFESDRYYYFAVYRDHLEDKALYLYRIKPETFEVKEIKKEYNFVHTNGFINVVAFFEGFVGISLISKMGCGIRKVSWANFILVNSSSETPEIVEITPDNTTFEKYEQSALTQFYKNFVFFPGSEVSVYPRLCFIGQYYNAQWANPQPSEKDAIYVYESTVEVSITYSQGQFTIVVYNLCYDFSFHHLQEPVEELKKSIANSFNLFPGIYEQNVVSSINVGDKTNFYTWRFFDGYMYPMGGVELDSNSLTEDTNISYTVPSVLEKGRFFITFNSGYVSNVISKNQNLIIPWNEIIDFPMVSNMGDYFCYKDKNKDYYLVKKDKLPTIKTIVNNRYILVESDSFYNAYDIKKSKWEKWSIGYNGALDFGFKASSNIYVPLLPITRYTPEPVVSVASAINANYEISENPFFSSIFPATRLIGYTNVNGGNIDSKLTSKYLDIDVYYASSKNSLIPKYKTTLRKNVSGGNYVNTTLLDLYYPENPNIVYSVSLMSKFIKSYNNHDFVIEGDKAYPFLYSNNHITFAYTALSFVEDIKNAFVIQNSNYLLFENKIMGVQYNNGVIGTSTIVADVTGMEFIGNTSQVAFFFSKLAKKIYTFTGDVVLNELRGANVIDKVYGSFFIPADNTIIVSCKEKDGDYVYFFGSDSFLKVANAEVKNCYYGDNKIILVDAENNANKYSYFKTQDGTKLPIELQTGFFGLGNEQTAELDCWYIRVFDEDFNNGKVRVKQNVLTNIGVKSEEKTINITSSTWDRLSKSYLIRYQPRYQNGVGFQLEINSDFAIYEVVASYKPGATQLTAPTAQI